jgi:hypothetical protein
MLECCTETCRPQIIFWNTLKSILILSFHIYLVVSFHSGFPIKFKYTVNYMILVNSFVWLLFSDESILMDAINFQTILWRRELSLLVPTKYALIKASNYLLENTNNPADLIKFFLTLIF